MVQSAKTKKGQTDGTTARVELSISRVVIQSPRSASKTKTKSTKTSTNTSTKTRTVKKQAGKTNTGKKRT